MNKFSLYSVSLAYVVVATFLPGISYARASVSTGIGIGASLTGDVINDSPTTTNDEPIVITHDNASAQLDTASAQAATTSNRMSIASEDIVRIRAAALVTSDAKISSVLFSSKNVSMTYREPEKLFGFIKINVPVRATVDANGDTSVSYPWYSFLFAMDQTGLSIEAHVAAKDTMNTIGSITIEELSPVAQIQLLTSLHAALSSTAADTTRR